MKSEVLKYLKRAMRQGSWPLIQRYSVFPKIVDLPPVECCVHAEISVHVLVCEKDSTMLQWCLRSFARHAPKPFNLFIHDDGSCSPTTFEKLHKKFPKATIVTKKDARERVRKHIGHIPVLMDWWEQDYIAVKCIDFYLFGESKWVIILDPDVLFFAEPREVFSEENISFWMQDCFYSLHIDPEEAQSLFNVTPPQVNGGLGKMERTSLDLRLMQEVVKFKAQPAIKDRVVQRGLPRFEDQTYHALLAARQHKCELLTHAYQVAVEPGLSNVIAKHYTTPARFWLYEEGIPRVSKQLGIKLPRWLMERG